MDESDKECMPEKMRKKFKTCEAYEAHLERYRNYYRKYSKKRSDYARLKKYGLTPEDYEALLEKQGNKCTICSKIFSDGVRAVVDHHHGSGRVRGILCDNCNKAIGLLGDDADIIEEAARYVRER